jgi:hypothetical protein
VIRGWQLLIAATVAAVFAAVLAWTGGFAIEIAGVRLRAHAWERPAIVAAVAFAAFVFAARAWLRPALRDGWHVIDSSTTARAILSVALAWTAIAGVRFGTFAAGGSDSYGYVSQAHQLRTWQLSAPIPAHPAFTWQDADRTLVPLAYRPAPDRRRMVPTYPPGLPLLMAAVLPLGDRALYLLVPLFGVCLVYFTYRAGEILDDPLSGALAAAFLTISPTFLLQLVQPMSDVPAAACWAGAVLLASRPQQRQALLAGIFTGAAVMIRPNLAPLAIVVAGLLLHLPHGRWRRLLVFLAPLAGAVAVLLSIQAARYGSPLGSGYGAAGDLFALANAGENLRLYTSWTTTAYTPVIWLFLAAPFVLRHHYRRPLFVALALLIALTWGVYLPYAVFRADEWFYTRFLLPALPFMLLFACMVLLAGARLLPAAARTVLVSSFVVGMMVMLGRTSALHVGPIPEAEQKYPGAGHFVRDSLPPTAVILAAQHSGSVRFYAGRVTVRWDLADGNELDAIVAALREGGFAPYLVLDAGEVALFRERFGGQRTIDRLRPLAEFGAARVYSVD